MWWHVKDLERAGVKWRVVVSARPTDMLGQVHSLTAVTVDREPEISFLLVGIPITVVARGTAVVQEVIQRAIGKADEQGRWAEELASA